MNKVLDLALTWLPTILLITIIVFVYTGYKQGDFKDLDIAASVITVAFNLIFMALYKMNQRIKLLEEKIKSKEPQPRVR